MIKKFDFFELNILKFYSKFHRISLFYISSLYTSYVICLCLYFVHTC